MNFNNKKIIVLAIVLFIGMAVIAATYIYKNKNEKWPKETLPNAKDEYSKLLKSFTNLSGLTNLKGIITLYDGEKKENNIKERNQFVFYKNDKKMHSQFGYQINITNGKLLYQIDTLEKLISISEVDDSLFLNSQNAALPFIDKVNGKDSYSSINAEISEIDGQRILQLNSMSTPQIASYKIFYNPRTYLINKTEITWWKGQRLEDRKDFKNVWITITDYQYQQNKILNIDSLMNSILIENNGVYRINSSQYLDYKLIVKKP